MRHEQGEVQVVWEDCQINRLLNHGEVSAEKRE